MLKLIIPGKIKPQANKRTVVVITLIFALILFLAGRLFTQYLLKNWDSTRLELALGKSLHRRVSLGHVQWSLTLTGLIFKSNKTRIDELDGKPFIASKGARVTMSLIPLLQGNCHAREVELIEPELWAVKISRTRWNFSDLPEIDAVKDLTHIGIFNGKLHIINDETDSDKTYDISLLDLNFRVDRPFGTRRWPYSLAFTLPSSQYETKVTVHGTGDGALDEWQTHTYAVNLQVVDFDPAVLRIFDIAPPPLTGPINCSLSGLMQGSQHFTGKIDFANPNYAIEAGRLQFTNSDTTTNGALDFTKLKGDVKLEQAFVHLPKRQFKVDDIAGEISFDGQTLTIRKCSMQSGSGHINLSGIFHDLSNYNFNLDTQNLAIPWIKQALSLIRPDAIIPSLQPLSGTLKTASLSITQKANQPALSVVAEPQGIFLQGQNKQRLFEVTGGRYSSDGVHSLFSDVALKMASGTARITGQIGLSNAAPMAIIVSLDKIDLSGLRAVFSTLALKLPSTPINFWEGTLAKAIIRATGTFNEPRLNLVAAVHNVSVKTRATGKSLQVTSGVLSYSPDNLAFDHLAGKIAQGDFVLDGHAATANNHAPLIDMELSGKNLDLLEVKSTLHDLELKSFLPFEQALAGTVQELKMKVKGPSDRPRLNLNVVPGDILFAPIAAEQALHLQGGQIILNGDHLRLDGVHIFGHRSNLIANAELEHMFTDCRVDSASINAYPLDIGDLQSYALSDVTPQAVQKEYLDFLNQYSISSPQGKLSGHLTYTSTAGSGYQLGGHIRLSAIAAKIDVLSVHDLSGILTADANTIRINHLHGFADKMKFWSNGQIDHYSDPPHRTFNNTMGIIIDGIGTTTVGRKPLVFTCRFSQDAQSPAIKFNALADSHAEFDIPTPAGVLIKPAGAQASLQGDITCSAEKVILDNGQLHAGDALVNLAFTYENRHSPMEARLKAKITLPNWTPINALLALASKQSSLDVSGGTGDAKGNIWIQGTLERLRLSSRLNFQNVALPKCNISAAIGKLHASNWSLTEPAGGKQAGLITIESPSFTIAHLPITNFLAKLAQNPDDKLTLSAMGDVAKGKLSISGAINQDRSEQFDATLSSVNSNEFLTGLYNAPNEVTGTMNLNSHLSSGNFIGNPLLTYKGNTQIVISKGKVSRFGLLEKKINEANLIKGGLLGFNLNNLFQSVARVERGEFKTLSGHLDLDEGTLYLRDITFDGEELRMRAKGIIDFKKDDMHIKVIGNIPRVSPRGLLGPMSPLLSVSSLAGTVEDLPVALLSGKKLDYNAPRVFTFSIQAPLDQANTISESIYKSFRWVPNSALAAHSLAPPTKGH